MEQADISAFEAGDDGEGAADRPDEEAVAVADGVGEGGSAAVVDPDGKRFPDADGDLELLVTQVDYTVERDSDGTEFPIMHVFGRGADDRLEHVRVHGFRPYFYAPTDTLDEEELAAEEVVTGWREEDENGDPYESIRGEKLTKVFGRTPRDVGNIRDRFEHFEADILFPNRFLIDKDIQSGVRVPARRRENDVVDVPHEEVEPVDADGDLRVNTFDIEVDDRSGFPEDGEEPVVCLTSHDSYDDEYVVWLYEAPGGDADLPAELDGYGAIDEGATHEVRTFDTEEAMLDAFLTYVEETDPDVLTGWNFEDFDAPYLVDRLDRLGMDSDRLSRVEEVWTSNYGGPNVKGRVVFDLLYAYQRTQFSELESYRLDAVGETELGVGKERYAGDIGDLWEEDPERLLEYNLRDVELCVELDRKQEIVAFWNEARKFVGCKLEDATTPGDAVDMYVLHKAHGRFALPSKGAHDAEDFEGGAVFDPITGVRENVTVLDLKSLYPMSMVTINASPETKVDPETFDGETYHTPNGVHFRKDRDGIIREMVEELLTGRDEMKARRDEHSPDEEAYGRYDRQQAALKVIMNSLYGVFGWDRFRLYDKEMSAGVTATNRAVIQFTEAAANERDRRVVYGDTDSVMLELGADTDKETAIEESFALEEYINGRYDEFAREELNAPEHRFQIEFEKLYRRFFQAGKKKRYAGHIVWKEGKDVDDIDITGFEYTRSDIAAITKRVQREVIERIVTGEDLDAVKDYVHGVVEDFRAGEVDLEEVAIPGGIGKRLDNYDTDTAQVRGAKYANLLLGTNFDRGDKPKRVYLSKVHPDYWDRLERERPDVAEDPLYLEFKTDPDVICFEYADQVPEEFEVDWEKMLDKTLKGPIARVLEALDIAWDEVRSGQTQTGLGNYM
jgi:DNA polymerase I/DNA polymerase-2